MRRHDAPLRIGVLVVAAFVAITAAPAGPRAADDVPSTANRPDHLESAADHAGEPAPPLETPPLPEGMSLDDVLDRAAKPPPESFPHSVADDVFRGFVLVDQLEYRVRRGSGDELGWEGQGWLGWDYDRLWIKSEGEAGFEGATEGGSETDVLYSRLITPFWNVQAGVQYANEWEDGAYTDWWSGAIALQGLAPGKFELDLSMYISQGADVTFQIEAEYDLRIVQRLVVQPRVELDFSAQDVPERNIGAGLVDATLDLRMRYEIKRQIAPYVGARFGFLVGETADIASASGRPTRPIFFVTGIRLAY